MHAEEHYQFRHAILRDAAYLLHTPALRGTLHRVALELYESELAIDLPEPAERLRTRPLPVDPLMAQLATHARYAQDEPYANLQRLREYEAAYLTRAGNYAERQYDHAQAISLWYRLAEISSGVIRFWAMQRVSHLCRTMSRLQEGLVVSEEALKLARRELPPHELVLGLAEIGLAHWFSDRATTAQKYLEEAVSLLSPDVSKSLEANTLGLLGMVYAQLGRSEEGEELCLRALELLKQAGDKHNEGVLLSNMGAMMLDAERGDEGERYLRRATELHEEINNEMDLGIGLNNLAMLEAQRGNYQQSIAYTEQAMPLLNRVGNRRSLGYSYSNRGLAHRRAGSFEKAKADANMALAIHREAGNHVSEGNAMCELGLIATVQGNLNEGRELWSRGIAIIRSIRGDEGATGDVVEMRKVCEGAGVEPFE